jgi:broad specificity phosphatase PhoE
MRAAALLVSLFLAAAALAGCALPTTIYVVRHAEPDTSNPADRDPSLSADGVDRARALAAITMQPRVSSIYVTQFKRTQETAQPTAQTLHVAPVVFPVGADALSYAHALVADILTRHQGEVVLVVGHSNTVPAIIEVLGGTRPAIGENEYDKFFEVTRRKDGTCDVSERRYSK